MQENQVVATKGIQIGKIIKNLKDNNVNALMQMLSPKGKTVVSSSKAAGVTQKEIKELRELQKKGKIGEKIKIKLSAPFIPAVLIAYLALNVIGDFLWVVLY